LIVSSSDSLRPEGGPAPRVLLARGAILKSSKQLIR
jgi:hypothetical protein